MHTKQRKTLCQTILLCVLLLCGIPDFQRETARAEELKLPWTAEAVKKALTLGTRVIYTMKGTDKHGKTRDHYFRYEITKADDTEIYLESQKVTTDYGKVTGTGTHEHFWPKDGTSPFFFFMRPTMELLQNEEVTVPAGTFKCIVVELKDMFGDTRNVWMIIDKPGMYAKVVEGKLTYELKEIQPAGES